MLHRRAFLSLSLLAAGALLTTETADARKVRPTVELFFGTELTQHEPGAVTVSQHGRPTQVKLLERVLPAKVDITSATNDNSVFDIRFELPRRTDPLSLDNRRPLARYFLRTATRWSWPTGTGRSQTSEMAMFQVDRASALLIGRQLGAPVQERQPLDKDVAFTWTVPATASLGAPIPIHLQLDNRGTDPVATTLQPAGFWLVVTRDDGTEVARRIPRHPGTVSGRKLGAGDSISLATDLGDHVILDKPGTYHVTATYTGWLVDGSGPIRARWDLKRTLTTTIVVR